jgi:hypothetical protein
MAAEQAQVRIYLSGDDSAKSWEYPQQVAKSLKWDKKQLVLRRLDRSNADSTP